MSTYKDEWDPDDSDSLLPSGSSSVNMHMCTAKVLCTCPCTCILVPHVVVMELYVCCIVHVLHSTTAPIDSGYGKARNRVEGLLWCLILPLHISTAFNILQVESITRISVLQQHQDRYSRQSILTTQHTTSSKCMHSLIQL